MPRWLSSKAVTGFYANVHGLDSILDRLIFSKKTFPNKFFVVLRPIRFKITSFSLKLFDSDFAENWQGYRFWCVEYKSVIRWDATRPWRLLEDKEGGNLFLLRRSWKSIGWYYWAPLLTWINYFFLNFIFALLEENKARIFSSSEWADNKLIGRFKHAN